MTAPERIWATPMDGHYPYGTFVGTDKCPRQPNADSTEYVRADLAPQWQPISTAPVETPVTVRVGHGMTFAAILRPDASLDDDGSTCAQWQAVHEDEHPPCWSGGACWASNEDGNQSLQPNAWQPATPETETEA